MLKRRSTRAAEAGFTLMELVVVLGIFATVVVAASDIFLIANRSQRRTFNAERVQADARFAMEAMVREVRAGGIDYAYYVARDVAGGGPITVPETELALVDAEENRIRFFRSDDADECEGAEQTPCLMVELNSTDAAPITPRGVALRSLAFFITPSIDPYALDPMSQTYAADAQPTVTIVLLLESAGRAGESAMTALQTTVVARTYHR